MPTDAPARNAPPPPPPPPPPPAGSPDAAAAAAAAGGGQADEPEWLAGTGYTSQTIPEALKPIYANLDKGWKQGMEKRANEHKAELAKLQDQFHDYPDLREFYETYGPLLQQDAVIAKRLSELARMDPWTLANGGAPAGDGAPQLTPEQRIEQEFARRDFEQRQRDAKGALEGFVARVGQDRFAPLAQAVNRELRYMAGSRAPAAEKLERAWRLAGGQWPIAGAAPAGGAGQPAAAGTPGAPGPERARGGPSAPIAAPPPGADSLTRMRHAALRAGQELGLDVGLA